MGDRIGQSNNKTRVRLVNIAKEGQIEDAPLALDIELLMLTHSRNATLTDVQATLHRFVARAEIDNVLAVLHGEFVEALMNALEALELYVFAEEIGLDRIGLELGEEDTGAAIQRAWNVHALEFWPQGIHDRLGQGSRLVERDLEAVKAEVLGFDKGKNVSR